MGTIRSKNAAANPSTPPVNKKAKTLKRKNSKTVFNLDLFFLSRPEVDAILGDSPQKCGTYIIYEDADTRRTFLALKSARNNVEHHPITYQKDLFYLGNFPFPYLESIVLYYKKHKLDSTRLTEPAFVEPYLMTTRRIGRSPKPCRKNCEESTMPEMPRTRSFIAKYGIYRPYSVVANPVSCSESAAAESEHMI